MAPYGGADVQQYYCVVLSDKSTGVEGARKAKRAAVVRLLRSVRCQRLVLHCSEADDSPWMEEVLRDAGLTLTRLGQSVSGGLSHHDVIVLNKEKDCTGSKCESERCKVIVNMAVPEELAYMQSLTETDDALPLHAVVTFVTPSELVNLKSFTQPNPEWKIKPLPEVLPGLRHGVEEDQQKSCAQPSSMPEGVPAGSIQTGKSSEEAAQGKEKQHCTVEELQVRKQRLLQTLDVLGSQSLQPAAVPAASQSAQNGHGHANQDDSIEDEVPPPPLGSPTAIQATAAANTGTHPGAGPHEAARGAASGARLKFHTQPAAVEHDTPPSSFPAASADGTERRTRQRSAQDAAARKEEQQELALERAILEIHWWQAEEDGGDDFMDGDAGGMAEDEEPEEGELTAQEPAAAEDEPMAAAEPSHAPAWHQHLPPFYQQWGRTAGAGKSGAPTGAQAADVGAAAHAEPSSQAAAWDEWYWQQGYSGEAADASVATGAEDRVQGSAWDKWYRQQGYSGEAAQAQLGAGVSGDGAAASVWEKWHSWQQQQQQQQGGGGSSAADWGSWPAGSQRTGAPSWAPQGMQGLDKEGFVSVPVALLQRYQMLEWAEWCRQYERWQASYEQWHTWWTSMMWQSSAHYSASTGDNTGAS